MCGLDDVKEFAAARGVSTEGRAKRGGQNKGDDTRQSDGEEEDSEQKEQVRGRVDVELTVGCGRCCHVFPRYRR